MKGFLHMLKVYLILALAVLCEALGLASLQASQQFTRLVPTVGVLAGFGGSFYLLTIVLKTLPLGITYAVWSGMGICLTAFFGWALFRQGMDMAAIIGTGLIIVGIAVINLFSETATH